MAAVVRVLWGDSRPGCRWTTVWHRDIMEFLGRKEECPQVVYVYGKRNIELLKPYKLKTVLVHDDPFPDGKEDKREGKVDIRPWHYKLQLIQAAMRDHGKIIYCDWDVATHIKRKEVAFDLLEDVEIALNAYSYARRRDAHFDIPRTGRSRRINVTGACMYLNSTSFVRRILEYMEEKDVWHDEIALNNIIDSMHGGWPGERTWLQTYENPTFCVSDHRSPWAKQFSEGGRVYRRSPVPFVWYKMFSQ